MNINVFIENLFSNSFFAIDVVVAYLFEFLIVFEYQIKMKFRYVEIDWWHDIYRLQSNNWYRFELIKIEKTLMIKSIKYVFQRTNSKQLELE